MKYIALLLILLANIAQASDLPGLNGLAQISIIVFVIYPLLGLQSLVCIVLALMHKFKSRRLTRIANAISFATLAAGLMAVLAYAYERSDSAEAVSLAVLMFLCGVIAWSLPNIQFNHFKAPAG